MKRRFSQVNVFSSDPLSGNPLAVMHAAEGLSDAQMAAPARELPGWCAVMLRSARQVLALKPDWASLAPLKLGVVGSHDAGHEAAFEVRAFVSGANASLAQWLIGAGLAKPAYIAAQGAALQRVGRVHVRKEGDEIWIGGDVVDVVRGEVDL